MQDSHAHREADVHRLASIAMQLCGVVSSSLVEVFFVIGKDALHKIPMSFAVRFDHWTTAERVTTLDNGSIFADVSFRSMAAFR